MTERPPRVVTSYSFCPGSCRVTAETLPQVTLPSEVTVGMNVDSSPSCSISRSFSSGKCSTFPFIAERICASTHSPISTHFVIPPSITTIFVSPVTDLTAVSMRPSRPDMAWKKNSVGVRPLMKEFSMKPRASAPSSNFLKCGSVRSSKPLGIRLPSMFCWPTQAIIWAMLMGPPLEPARTIAVIRFSFANDACPALPARSRALLRVPNTLSSNSC